MLFPKTLALLKNQLRKIYSKIFTKAGKPGWASLIPFYNAYILLLIIGRPGWWLLFFFVPCVNMALSILISIELAKAFGRSVKFAIFGLIIFSFIGYPLLAFGDAKYKRASMNSKTAKNKKSKK